MADYFSSNMEMLSEKNRSLATAVHDTGTDGSFEVLRTESGNVTVRRHAQDGTCRFIHSTVDPVREARTWLDCQSVDTNYAVILGIGLAYHVAELRRAFPGCKRLLLMEADPALFRLTLEFADLSDIFSDPKVHLAIGQDLHPCEQILSEYPFESFSYHPFLPVMSLHPEPYHSLISLHEQHLYKMRFHGRGGLCGKESLAGGVKTLLDEMRAS